MAFADELSELVVELYDLAWEKRREQWTLSIPWSTQGVPQQPLPPSDFQPWPAVECDFAILINELVGRFGRFGEGDPDAFQIMLDGMGDPEQFRVPELLDDSNSSGEPAASGSGLADGYLTVNQNIQAVWDGDVPAAGSLMAGWAGAPSDFLARLRRRAGSADEESGRVVEQQLTYLAELGAVTHAYQQILRGVRTDVLAICRTATQKLGAMFSGSGNAGYLDIALETAGIAATVIGVSKWVNVALRLGGHLRGLDGAAPDSSPDEVWSIGGDTVEDVIQSVDDAITRLEQLVLDQDDVIVDALQADLPKTEGVARDDFRLSPDGDGLTSDTGAYSAPLHEQVHIVYRDLYIAGYVYFSSAAYHYQAAARRLNLCTLREDTAFGSWFARSRPDWSSLRDNLETVLNESRDYLTESGDALVTAAREYAERDAEIAGQFERLLDEGLTDENGDPSVLSVDQLQEETVSINELDERMGGPDESRYGRDPVTRMPL